MEKKISISSNYVNFQKVQPTRSATEGSNPRMNRKWLTENHKLYTEEAKEGQSLERQSKWI